MYIMSKMSKYDPLLSDKAIYAFGLKSQVKVLRGKHVLDLDQTSTVCAYVYYGMLGMNE